MEVIGNLVSQTRGTADTVGVLIADMRSFRLRGEKLISRLHYRFETAGYEPGIRQKNDLRDPDNCCLSSRRQKLPATHSTV